MALSAMQFINVILAFSVNYNINKVDIIFNQWFITNSYSSTRIGLKNIDELATY